MNHLIANRYLLEAELARGAAGIVHRAVDQESGDKVAIKVLHFDSAQQPEMASAFLDEAEVLSQLDHPGIVRPRDLIADGETLALVMDLVEGRDLRRILAADGPYAPSGAAALVAQVCEALAAVHAAGVVHGDVKPGNVLIAEATGSPKLVDFGVARRVAQQETPTRGTPDYTAPEVVRGSPSSAKTDMYGVGLVLYEAMCATNPYRGGGVEAVLDRHCQMIPQRPQHVPPELWMVIDSCLSADPAQRPDAAGAATRLRAAAGTVSREPVAVLSSAPPMQLREAPVTGPPHDVHVNPVATTAAASPVTGPPTTVAPAVIVPGMGEDNFAPSSKPTRVGLWAGAAAGVVALVAVCVLWLASVAGDAPTQVQKGEQQQSSQESGQPSEGSESPSDGESASPSSPQSPSTDGEDSQSSGDSNEDGGAPDNPGDGSDSPRSETDGPGNGPIGSPFPGSGGGN